jgi:nudix-type nucleoside diphosphatase (YffH/AdpP family)
MIDPDEAPDAAARREAMEELGVRLGELEPIATVWASPGVIAERVHLFLAPFSAADRVAAGGGLEAEREDIEVVECPLRDLADAADRGAVVDAKLLILVQALRLRNAPLFRP